MKSGKGVGGVPEFKWGPGKEGYYTSEERGSGGMNVGQSSYW